MALSLTAQEIAAKSGREEEGWLPLWMHLSDTAGTAERLVQQWLPASAIQAMGLSEKRATQIAIFLAAIHDIGKCTSLFQSNITQHLPENRERLQQCNLRLFSREKLMGTDAKKSPHALAGEAVLQYFDCPPGGASVVGSHHGKPQESTNNIDMQLLCYGANYYGPSFQTGDKTLWEGLWKEWEVQRIRVVGKVKKIIKTV